MPARKWRAGRLDWDPIMLYEALPKLHQADLYLVGLLAVTACYASLECAALLHFVLL
jgi:hypothetical protein